MPLRAEEATDFAGDAARAGRFLPAVIECPRAAEQTWRIRLSLVTDRGCEMLSCGVSYQEFVERNGGRLRAALVGAYGPDVGGSSR